MTNMLSSQGAEDGDENDWDDAQDETDDSSDWVSLPFPFPIYLDVSL